MYNIIIISVVDTLFIGKYQLEGEVCGKRFGVA